MKKFKNYLFLTLMLVFSIILTPTQFTFAQTADVFDEDMSGKIVVIHTNDVHGRLQYGVDGSLGYVSVAAFKNVLLERGAEVLLLDAGDVFHGRMIAGYNEGQTVVELLNALGYDATTPGNHDFNYGSDRLLELSELADFPILSANVRTKESEELFLLDSTIIEKGNVTFGIFGLSTTETEVNTNPKNVATLKFHDPIDAARVEVEKLSAAGVDFIIGIGHLGIDDVDAARSFDVIEAVEGIDLFVDGHSHLELDKYLGKADSDTVIVSDGGYLNKIGCVIIDENLEMTPIEITSDVLSSLGIKTELSEGEKEDAIESEIGKMVLEAEKAYLKEMEVVVATTDVHLEGEKITVRISETNLGNLATDSLVWATGADIAVMNGGNIRVSIEIGDITKGNILDAFPFGSMVVTKEVPGQLIYEMLEHSVEYYPEAFGGFLQVSGMEFSFSPDNKPGNRVKDVKINDEELDMDKVYVVATTDFMIAGGNDYYMLSDEVIPNHMEYGALDETLIAYMQTNPNPESYEVGRITILDESNQEKEPEKPIIDMPTEEKPNEENESQVIVHKVASGDYLRKIANQYLGNEAEWKKIYEWNQTTIKHPDKIYIGQELIINIK